MSESKLVSPDRWVQEYGDILYRYALVRVRSEATAEDMVQETLLAALKAYNNFSGQSTVRTWLIGILKHKIVDHFRKNRHEILSLDENDLGEDLLSFQFDQNGHWKVDLIEWATPDKVIDNADFHKIFDQCISNLPRNMADLFILNTIEGLSSKDCCKVLNISTTNQMWVALSRTRMKLRLCLDTHWFNKE